MKIPDEASLIRAEVLQGIHDKQFHLEFIKLYPKLYEKLVDNKTDDNMLLKLISLREQVEKKTISQDTGDKLFGKVAATKYIDPLLN